MTQKILKTILAIILCIGLFSVLQLPAILFIFDDNTQYVIKLIQFVAAIIAGAVLVQVLRKIWK